VPGSWPHRVGHLHLARARFRRGWRLLPVTVPRILTEPGSSSRELPSSSESCLSRACPNPSPGQSTFLGVAVPLRDVHRPGLVMRSQPHHHPSSAFCTPSTSCTRSGFAGLFHPAAASRVPPFRGFPSSHSRTSSSLAVALSSVGPLCLRPGCPCRASSACPVLRALFRAWSP
jgi:hypothetical protein